ncbi:MAG TPA: SusC/RagA family TonB-linked outer membrane protein, partial [Longimicrobiales bacterium]
MKAGSSGTTGRRARALRTPGRIARAALLLVLGAAGPLTAQQTGAVGGVVVDARTGQPLVGAAVQVVGTNRGTITNDDGRFLLSGLDGAQVTLTVSMIGYSAATVDARAGQMDLRVALEESAVALDEIVVTGTAGGETKRALGTTIAKVRASEVVEKAPVNTITELINGRAAGVMIINTTGMIGGGNRVRIRGGNSFSLSGEPLVYIDGVRVNNDQSTGPINQAFGSSSISRWNDLNPEDIESIEIIKGPAAATLYGTEASNGVIQIITKKGAAGDARFNLSIKQGANWFADPEGRLWVNYFDVGGDGTVETIDMVELEKSRGNDIWQTGHIQQYDLSISGGTDRARYYVSGNYENSTGVDPENGVEKWGARANVTVAATDEVNVTGSIGYLTGRTDLAFEAGGGGNTWTTYFATPANLDKVNRGFYSYAPEVYASLFDSWQDLERTTVSINVDHQPTPWFSHRLTIGRDYTREQDNELMHHDERWLEFEPSADEGYKEMWDRSTDYTTVDYSATVRVPVPGIAGLESSTSFGGQFYRYYYEHLYAYGEAFPTPGLTSISATTRDRVSSEYAVENVTLGGYVQEQLAWQNRLFLTAALRMDDNSAFGSEFDLVSYPKVSAAWVISEEPFWSFDAVNTLKLRAAYGRSGLQPDAFAAIPTYRSVTGPGGVGTVTPDNIGNPELGPEVGEEIELGFDADLLDGRVGVELTYYHQNTRDAILLREVAPSTGYSGEQYINAGEIRNSGIELLVTGTPWRTDRHALDIGFNLATNSNEVVSLGDVTDEGSLSGGTYIEHRVGYPVGSWFGPRVVEATWDGDSIPRSSMLCDNGAGGTTPCYEGSTLVAPSVFLGRTIPEITGGFNATLTLFDNLRIFGQLDFKTGFSKLDGNFRVRCVLFSLCRENWYPTEYDAVYMAE